MLTFQTTGYKPKSMVGDVSLGIFKGIDNGLWAYGFAAIIFAGALSAFMPAMLVILLVGWAVMGLFTGLTSSVRVHLVNMDEQAIVILSTIAGLMVTKLGPEAATHAGLATMLAIMTLTSLAVGLSFLLVGRFHLTRLLELLPYPVICGFMAGIGWLLLQAGVGLAVDLPISIEVVRALTVPENLIRLAIMIVGAILLMFAAQRSRHAWSLPAAALVIVLVFYLFTSILGYSTDVLVAHNWLFDVSSGTVSMSSLFTSRALFAINIDFVLSVFPQILTIAFLAMLTASMSLSAMVAGGHSELVTAHEMQNAGVGNVGMGFMACPPVYIDVTSSLLYSRFGASSRMVAIVSSVVTLGIAIVGGQMIGFMPTILVGSVVFLFAFTMLYDWMYQSVRGFQPVDYAIVCIILGAVIFVGFMAGVLVGVLMALLLFVMRYSMISAVQGQYSLSGYRSSVERSPRSNQLLDEHGSKALVYSLRGFLFFGTANAILDLIRDESGIKGGSYTAILLDLKRVTGMDISALKTFLQIRRICEANGVQLLYSGIPRGTEQRIVMLGAVSMVKGKPLFFKEADYAVEYIENTILHELGENVETKSVATYLQELLHDQDKVRILMAAMDRIDCGVGQTLFQQGDDDTGLYMLEHGSMTALIGTKTNGMKRVKKFNAGSVIGEMSSYTPDKKRTATIIANEPSVLYHLSAKKMAGMDESDPWLVSSIHELVARTLGARITYMNRRLIQELR